MKYLKGFNESIGNSIESTCKKYKLFEDNNWSDEIEINKYLGDLLGEYKVDGVSYKMVFSLDKNLIYLDIQSEVLYNRDESEWYCFTLYNCIDSIKHLISYIYSLEYELKKSSYYELSYHRERPYGFVMDPSNDLNSVFEFMDRFDKDICKLELNFVKK